MRVENLAILLTDIKGYTARTAAQSRDEGQNWLGAHEALVVPVIFGFGGEIRQTIGDAILATFSSPTNAALAAVAIQDRLFAYNRQTPEGERVEVRAVLTVGEVQCRKKELIGEAVAVVMRLDKFANAGEVVMTEALVLAMNKAEVPSRELTSARVEGVHAPLRLFRAEKDANDATAPYGGHALSRLQSLPPVDHAWIMDLKHNRKTRLRRDVRALRASYLALPTPGGRRGFRAMSWGLGLLAAVLVVGAAWVTAKQMSDPLSAIEHHIQRGAVEDAKAAARTFAAKHPSRVADKEYLWGRIAYLDRRPADAARFFSRAIALDPKLYTSHSTIRSLMEDALLDERCEVRSEAARTLGALGDAAAKPALQTALQEEEARSNFLTGLFCRFSAHAREAIARLE